MDRSDRIILVTGGTGHQGGASARHLLADGWRVRALVRDPGKPAARALEEAGAELIVGDLRDRPSLDAAVAGAYGVYSVQTGADGPDVEVVESKNLAEAANNAGVQHFVYSSVRGADRPSAIPWVVGKATMEPYLRSLGLPLTIWRPVTFMENMLRQREGIRGGTLTGIDAPDIRHQWIAVDDIGRFVALSFREPDAWLGKATEIAGDELTGPEAAAAFSLALGLPVAYQQVEPPPGMPAPAAITADEPPPRQADIAALREHIPDLWTLEAWARDARARALL